MNKKSIDEAAHYARRFLVMVNDLKKTEENARYEYQSFPKETGALRRASMDLTRALAKMRKPM